MNEQLTSGEVRWLFGVLRTIEFFATATIENIDRIIASFRKVSYPKGKVIIEEGKPGSALYIIKSGECLVYRKAGLFKITKLAELCENDVFGEMSLVRDTPTSASVKTTKPSEIFVYEKKDFLVLLARNPKLKTHIAAIAQERTYLNEGKFDEAERMREFRRSIE